jgi:hypothetical protein
MVIAKKALFKRTLERWPSTVRVSPFDGVPGFQAQPSLVDVHEAIEAQCNPGAEWSGEDEWTKLANWSFHQALWALAEGTTSERDLSRDEVTFEMFDDAMRFNLSDDCWTSERAEYDASPTRFH